MSLRFSGHPDICSQETDVRAQSTWYKYRLNKNT